MKIKTKEKTVRSYKVAFTEEELIALHSEVYDISHIVDLADRPALFDLLDTLRAAVHSIP